MIYLYKEESHLDRGKALLKNPSCIWFGTIP